MGGDEGDSSSPCNSSSLGDSDDNERGFDNDNDNVLLFSSALFPFFIHVPF